MTDKQFEEMISELREMNNHFDCLEELLNDVKESVDTLQECMTQRFDEDEKNKGSVYSLPWVLHSILERLYEL